MLPRKNLVQVYTYLANCIVVGTRVASYIATSALSGLPTLRHGKAGDAQFYCVSYIRACGPL